MLTINGNEKFVIDLNDHANQDIFEVGVESSNGSTPINWGVDSVLCSDISYDKNSNILTLHIKRGTVKVQSYIILRNALSEYAVIQIIPNTDELGEKKYIFSASCAEINGRTVTFNVNSKLNGKKWDWEVTYSGNPISYEIEVFTTRFKVHNIDDFDMKRVGHIELTQKHSNKKVEIELLHENCEDTRVLSINKVG